MLHICGLTDLVLASAFNLTLPTMVSVESTMVSVKVLYIVGALQGFLAEHFTPIRKPVCIENMNLLDFPPFLFVAKVY